MVPLATLIEATVRWAPLPGAHVFPGRFVPCTACAFVHVPCSCGSVVCLVFPPYQPNLQCGTSVHPRQLKKSENRLLGHSMDTRNLNYMHGLGFRKSNSERRSKSASRRSKRGCMAVAGAIDCMDGELCGPVPDLLGQGREQPTLSSRKPTQDRGAWPGYTHKSIHRTLSKT